MPQLWSIVGGEGKGGVIVREGRDLASPKAAERLVTGAQVEELELLGERLHFRRVAGTGPKEGWISIALDHKPLAEPLGEPSPLGAVDHKALREPGAEPSPLGATDGGDQTESVDSSRKGGFQQRIDYWKKVKIKGLTDSDSTRFNGKNGSVEDFDPETGRYKVKVVILSGASGLGVGRKSDNQTYVWLRYENIQLHADQVEKDAALTGDEIVLLGAGEAKRRLYEVKLDPQHWYDKAIERVFNAKNDFEVLDLPLQRIRDMSDLKRAYRKISLAVHPDKNQHPQATDAFRKVYGAFETLMDERQQRRLLWVLGKLDQSEEEEFTLEEDEEDELFQWWWEASVPEIEKQVAEFEGQQLDEFGAMWISDGLGGNVEEVRWIGLETAKRLHAEANAIFVDARDWEDFQSGHIDGAYCTPLPDIIDWGLVPIFMEAGEDFITRLITERQKPIIIYSEVATPFSRCRAFCRWLLRAGHQTIKVERVRRLRGGIFGWKHKNGPISRPLVDSAQAIEDRRKREDMLRAEALDLPLPPPTFKTARNPRITAARGATVPTLTAD